MFKLISSQGQIFSQLQSFSHQAKNYLTSKVPQTFFSAKIFLKATNLTATHFIVLLSESNKLSYSTKYL